MEEKQYCPTLDATQMLTKRWTILLVKRLLEGPQRFSEMEGSLQISGRILSERLRELEMEELIKRHVYPDIPVRVEYVLTDKGRAMKPIIQQIEIWAKEWVKQRPDGSNSACPDSASACPTSDDACPSSETESACLEVDQMVKEQV